jgi:predicted ATPase
MVLWHLGYPAQALQRNHEALTLALELSHPSSLFMGLTFAISVHQFRREAQVILEHVEALDTLAVEHGFQSGHHGRAIMRGWALAEQGRIEEGIRQMRQALTSEQEVGSERTTPSHLALLAEAYGKAGQTAEGLAALDAAVALVHKHAERYVEAELYRLQGALLLQQPAAQQEEAAARFQQALAVARHQQAKSLELRAAISLARLWQHQDKRAEARELLAPIYGWFTEGFDTADLREAKAWLEELGR